MLSTAIRALAVFWLIIGSAAAVQVHLMPAGPMVADGITPVTLHIWVPGLLEPDRVKVKPAHGKVMATERHPGGMIAVSWVPAREGGPTQVPVLVTVKKKGLDPETVRLNAPLTAPREGHISVRATPTEWEPGQDAVQLKFTLSGTSKQNLGARRILLSASTGSLSEAMPLGDGTFSARWTPPESVKQARTAIITAVDASAPSTIYGWTSIPMLAQQSLTFGATPDSKNTLKIGDREFGPMTASPAGTVAFTALVHPAIRTGELTSHLTDGRTITVPSPLPLAEYTRVAFFAQPPSIPIGGEHTVLVVGTKPDGTPIENAEVTIGSGAATIGPAQPTGSLGVYALTMKAEAPSRVLPLNVTMKDPAALVSNLQKAQTQLNVINGLPQTTLEISPDPIPLKGREVVLTATIQDESGNPVRASLPGMVGMPARALGRPASRGDGRYQFKIRPEGDALVGAAVPRFKGSLLSPTHLVIIPAAAAVETSGTIPVMVAATDAFGIPVPNVEFQLAVPNGGTFPEKVKSGDNGIALTTYSASDIPGLFTISAHAAGLSAESAIFHGDLAASPGLVRSGDIETMSQRTALESVVGVDRVIREQPQATAAMPVAVVATPPSQIKPTTTPAAPAAPKAPTAAPSPPPTAETPPPSTPSDPQSSDEKAAPKTVKETKPPKAPRRAPAPTGDGQSVVGFALQSVLHSFKQTADNPDTAENVMPPEASFTRPVSPGLILDGMYGLTNSQLSVVGEFRIYNDVIAVGDMLHGYNNWSAQVGARYALATAPDFNPFLSASLQRTQTNVFRFVETESDTANEVQDDAGNDDAPGDEEDTVNINQFAPAVESLLGVRIGGGIQRELTNDLGLMAELSELFGPYPIATHLGATIYRAAGIDWRFRGSIDMDFKHVAMSIDGVPLKVRDTEVAFSIGLDYTGL